MRPELTVLISTLAVCGTLGITANAATRERNVTVVAAPAAAKPKPAPMPAPAPSGHYATAHAGSTGHPWKF